MQQVAIFVHFIRRKSFLPSPGFNHTQSRRVEGRKRLKIFCGVGLLVVVRKHLRLIPLCGTSPRAGRELVGIVSLAGPNACEATAGLKDLNLVGMHG